MMGWRTMVAVGLGGMLGCLLRWFLAVLLNRYFPAAPPGTLAANLIGCYVIGLMLALFAANPLLSLEWKLFITTGFCGGLTTFSTFSAEVVALMQGGRMALAAGTIALHVVGALAMTMAGFATVAWTRS